MNCCHFKVIGTMQGSKFWLSVRWVNQNMSQTTDLSFPAENQNSTAKIQFFNMFILSNLTQPLNLLNVGVLLHKLTWVTSLPPLFVCLQKFVSNCGKLWTTGSFGEQPEIKLFVLLSLIQTLVLCLLVMISNPPWDLNFKIGIKHSRLWHLAIDLSN